MKSSEHKKWAGFIGKKMFTPNKTVQQGKITQRSIGRCVELVTSR